MKNITESEYKKMICDNNPLKQIQKNFEKTIMLVFWVLVNKIV